MTTILTGTISSIFPDDINTDDIIPAWTLQESTDPKYFKKYAFEKYDEEFIKRCKRNSSNIIIAGENFGCGSSREQAVYAIQENNIVAVIAKSFPDIFYRNSLNNGLVLIQVDDTSAFTLERECKIDLEKKIITTDQKHISFVMSDLDSKTFSLGGKIERVKLHLEQIISSKTKGPKYFEAKTKKAKPQTIVEKIISDHVCNSVYQGEVIDHLPIDILYFNEVIGPPSIEIFKKEFADSFRKNSTKMKVFNRERVMFIPDHTVPSSSVAVSEGITYMENFAKDQKVKCYREGDGIEHVVFIEDGYIVPGEIILGTDSHTDTNGALNTLAFGVGTTDGSFALATGHIYDFEVPNTVRVNIQGVFNKGVYAKDFILYLIGKIGVDGAVKQVVEFGGPGLKHISMDGRTTIANMAVELGARTGIFEPDKILMKYVDKIKKFPYKTYLPDKNCSYSKTIDIDLSELEPQIAFPHKPSNVTPVSRLDEYLKKSQHSSTKDFPKIGTLKISDAFLGACTNGRYEDFVEAAKILKGQKVHTDVSFVAIPASRKIYKRILNEGIMKVFIDAGVNVESSNCGPCFGKHMGVIGRGAQMISSSNRNYIGRMGSKDGGIFLASPASVAAAAIKGEITDPRKYLI